MQHPTWNHIIAGVLVAPAIVFAAALGAIAAHPQPEPTTRLDHARYIDIPGHGQYQVAIDSVATSAVLNGRSGNVSSGVGLVPLPFVGTAVGAFNYIHAGKNAVVPAGTRFIVVPVGNLKTRARCAL